MAVFQVLNPYATGLDHSVNAPAGPAEGAQTFAYNGTTYTLLSSFPANPSRVAVNVYNTTGSICVVVIDNGDSFGGSVTLYPLAAGTGQFVIGGTYTSISEMGRIRVYGVAGTYLSARENATTAALSNTKASVAVKQTIVKAVGVAANP